MTVWWQAPRLHREGDEDVERKVGFLDLFYDLIFVVAVAQLAHGLAKHPDWTGLGTFALLFTPVWWLWIGNTFYTDRFETEDVSHRLFTFLQMIPVVGLAVFAHGALHETSDLFVISYVVGRLIIIALWWRGGHHDPEARPATRGYVLGFSIGAGFWTASLFTHGHLRIALWIIGLVIDLATPSLLAKQMAMLPKFSHSRLAERFGLFTIIVLGESVAGTAIGLAELGRYGVYEQLTGLLAMILGFSIWWIYFEVVPRDHIKPTGISTRMRSYLHLPLLGAIAATGAGVLSVVGHADEALDAGHRILLTGSVVVTLVTLIGLSRVHLYHPMFIGARTRTEGTLWVSALGAAILGWAGGPLNALTLLATLVGITLIPIVMGLVVWARSAAAAERDAAD